MPLLRRFPTSFLYGLTTSPKRRVLPLALVITIIFFPLLFHTRALWMRNGTGTLRNKPKGPAVRIDPEPMIKSPKPVRGDTFTLLDLKNVRFIYDAPAICHGLDWDYDYRTVPKGAIVPSPRNFPPKDILYVEGPWWPVDKDFDSSSVNASLQYIDSDGDVIDDDEEYPIPPGDSEDPAGEGSKGHRVMSLLIALHSEPKDFESRTTMRAIWSSPFSQPIKRIPWVRMARYKERVLTYVNFFNQTTRCRIRLVFILGLYQPRLDPLARQNVSREEAARRIKSFAREKGEVDAELRVEAQKYGDIVQASIVDSYQNLSYKTGALFKWVSTRCSNAQLFVKMDFDIYARLDLLVSILENVTVTLEWQGVNRGNEKVAQSAKKYGLKPGLVPPPPTSMKGLMEFQRYIYCNVWVGMGVIRDPSHKNAVSRDTFGPDIYPTYCSGMAYVLSPVLAGLIYRESLECCKYPFANEDVFWTGIVPIKLNISRVALNNFYKYTEVDWTGGPFIFSFYYNMKHLWELYFGEVIRNTP